MKKLLSMSVLVLLSCSGVVLVLDAQQRQMREPGCRTRSC